MRLVKGARRRSLAIAAVFACACSNAPKPAVAMDCTGVLNRPREPRLLDVGTDGGLAPGTRLDSVAGVAGYDESFVRLDGRVLHVAVGQRSFDVDAPVGSRLHASGSLSGVMVGEGVVGIDRAGVVELDGADGSIRTAAMPSLPDGATLGSPVVIAGGVMAYVGEVPKAGEKRRLLIPFDPPPPAGTSWPAYDARSRASAGFIAPGEHGAVVVAGNRVELGVPVLATESVTKLDDDWLVFASARRATLVQPGHASLEVDPKYDELHVFDGGIFEIAKQSPPSIALLRDGAWSTVLGGDAARDLAGAPLPRGAVVVRIETATHDGKALAIERVQLETCALDDRVFLVDVARGEAKQLAAGGEKMRVHPMYAGDRFRFVEAAIDSSMP